MWNQTLTLLLAFGFYTAGIAFSQTAAPNPTQQPVAVADGQTPLFRVTVVGRTNLEKLAKLSQSNEGCDGDSEL